MNDKLRTSLFITFLAIIILSMLLISPYSSPQLQSPERSAQLQSQDSIEGQIVITEKSSLTEAIALDLKGWKPSEVAQAIARYNKRLEATPYNYKYNDDCTYYSLYGELFGTDSFCSLAFPIQGPYGQEWNDGHLRIVSLGNEIRYSSEEKYKQYLDDVLKETQIDPDLNCYAQEECNGIKVISCTKDKHNYLSWYEGNFLMSSYDDARRNLDAFTKFYCSSELKPLTGNIVADLSEEDYLVTKLANLFKKLS